MPSFKNPQGAWYTTALFIDGPRINPTTPIDPVFTLYDSQPGYISCRDTFVELRDPSGYKWVMRYLNGSWDHWEKLLETPWFRKALDSWKDILHIRLKSEALERIQEIASSEGASAIALQANKFLATREYEKEGPTPSKRGRPSKEELTGELKKAAEIATSERDDLERIGLRLVKG